MSNESLSAWLRKCAGNEPASDDVGKLWACANEIDRLRSALKPFALISREGLVADDVYTTVTTVSDYFHAASRAMPSSD